MNNLKMNLANCPNDVLKQTLAPKKSYVKLISKWWLPTKENLEILTKAFHTQ